MLAAAAGKGDVGVLLVERFPECVSWTNKLGLDAVSYLLLLLQLFSILSLRTPSLNTLPLSGAFPTTVLLTTATTPS